MITIKENGMVDARELHKFVEVKTLYWDWVNRVIDYADLQEGKDFNSFLGESTGGRPSKKIEFTLDSAKEVCIVSATPKAKELRRWLISLSNQFENNELFNKEQILYLIDLKEFFKYVSNCKDARETHQKTFVEDYEGKRNPYAEFNVYRNYCLDLGKDKLNEKIKQYCIENHHITKAKTQVDKLALLDKYDILKNGVWDFLMSGRFEQEKAMKLANLVKDMAKREGAFIKRVNETNLIEDKENLPKIELPKLILQ